MCLLHTTTMETVIGLIADIEEHVQLSVGKMTHYTQHVGGTWYVLVDSKLPTVDIRQWYKNSRAGTSLKPILVGIALTYFNWEKLKNAIIKVDDEIPALIVVSPCWHDSQSDQMFCDECSPFHNVEDVTDVRCELTVV